MARVDAMTDNEIRKVYEILKSMLTMWGFSSLEANDLVVFMDSLEATIGE